MGYSGEEKRKYPRIDARFIVSYRSAERDEAVDVSQTKNLSLGGMLITTSAEFEKDSKIIVEIRVPLDPHPLKLMAKVVACREISKGLIYDTRLEFLSVDDRHKDIIGQTVEHYLKLKKKE